jgi:hypothetical protein
VDGEHIGRDALRSRVELPSSTSSNAAKPTPIDGVYSLNTTRAESRAAGTPETDLVAENYGQWRFVLDRGRLYYTQSSEGASRWTLAVYTVKGKVLEFTVTAYGGEAPHGAAEKTGEVFTFRWSRYAVASRSRPCRARSRR